MLAPRQPAVWIERWLQRSTAAREARDVLLDDATWPPNQKGRMKNLPISSFAAGMMMHPTMACPLDWTRTSGFQSGGEQGRYLCGFRARLAAAHNCTIFSFGSNFEWAFEASVQRMARQAGRTCNVHIFDPTLGPPQRVQDFRRELAKSSIELHEVALTSDGRAAVPLYNRHRGRMIWCNTTSLARLVESHGCPDVLKMDVEGFELAALEFYRRKPPRWCAGMLLLEFHPDKLRSSVHKGNVTLGLLMDVVQWLEAASMQLYHSEVISPLERHFGRMELAFVNTSWLSGLSMDAAREVSVSQQPY